jgi:hypothetical protein
LFFFCVLSRFENAKIRKRENIEFSRFRFLAFSIVEDAKTRKCENSAFCVFAFLDVLLLFLCMCAFIIVFMPFFIYVFLLCVYGFVLYLTSVIYNIVILAKNKPNIFYLIRIIFLASCPLFLKLTMFIVGGGIQVFCKLLLQKF